MSLFGRHQYRPVTGQVDCEERASIACARLILGTSSKLKAVTLRFAKCLTSSRWPEGAKKLSKDMPSGNSSASSSVGGWTLTTRSAPSYSPWPPSTSLPRPPHNPCRDIGPAPQPRARRLFRHPLRQGAPVPPGTSATRCSPGLRSFGTTTFMGLSAKASLFGR